MTITKQNAINALTTTQLRRVELYVKGLTYEEIAGRENVGQSALSLSLTRARRKLGVNTTEKICQLLGLTCMGHGPVNQHTRKKSL